METGAKHSGGRPAADRSEQIKWLNDRVPVEVLVAQQEYKNLFGGELGGKGWRALRKKFPDLHVIAGWLLRENQKIPYDATPRQSPDQQIKTMAEIVQRIQQDPFAQPYDYVKALYSFAATQEHPPRPEQIMEVLATQAVAAASPPASVPSSDPFASASGNVSGIDWDAEWRDKAREFMQPGSDQVTLDLLIELVKMADECYCERQQDRAKPRFNENEGHILMTTDKCLQRMQAIVAKSGVNISDEILTAIEKAHGPSKPTKSKPQEAIF